RQPLLGRQHHQVPLQARHHRLLRHRPHRWRRHQLINLSTAIGGTSQPNALASDGDFLYWTDGATNLRGIYRVETDGTNFSQVFATGGTTAAPIGLTLIAAVPEPATVILFGTIAVAGAGYVWRRRRATPSEMDASVRRR